MIVSINGAFGSGKTQTAHELNRRCANSFVYDPEQFGYWMRKNQPKPIIKDDFQNEPLWRTVNCDMLTDIASRFDGVIFVPMTITSLEYYDQIIGKLRDNGIDVRHILLSVSENELRKRLRGRLEGPNKWSVQQIGRCISAFRNERFENKITTDDLRVPQVADQIAEICSLELSPGGRGVKQWWRQVMTQIGVINRFKY